MIVRDITGLGTGGCFFLNRGKGMGGRNLFVGGVIAAGAGVIGFPAVFRTGGSLSIVALKVMAQRIHICLLLDHIAAHGTDLSFGQSGFRTGGSTGEHLLRMLGGIPRNPGEGQIEIVAALGLLNQYIGLGAEVALNGHMHRAAGGMEGVVVIFFQEVELNIRVRKDGLGHGGAVLKEFGADISTSHSGSFQTGTPAEHPVAGTDS